MTAEWLRQARDAARAEPGTTTIKDTVNEALRRATSERQRRIASALYVLASADLDDRADAWRRATWPTPAS